MKDRIETLKEYLKRLGDGGLAWKRPDRVCGDHEGGTGDARGGNTAFSRAEAV